MIRANLNAYQSEILSFWDAAIYEQDENYTHDYELLLKLLGDEPKRILDVACGAGRMTLPLAKAGHKVEGFDVDPYMLDRLYTHLKTGQYPTASAKLMDGIANDWGENYDIVVLGANLLCNIIVDGKDYTWAQQLFIEKAYKALKKGGKVFIDFDCPDWPDETPEGREDRILFEGYDERGTLGKIILRPGYYDSATRISRGYPLYEMTTKAGETFTAEWETLTHFPTWSEVKTWLTNAGFSIEQLFTDYEPANEGREGCRITLMAVK